MGEIDLIARQGKTLVIVEVKTRKSTRFGSPQEAVSAAKQAKLRRLADYYLQEHNALPELRCGLMWWRFLWQMQGPQIEIISNAF